MDRPRMRVSSVVLGAADPRALAAFYHRLLGWTVTQEYPARPGFPAEDGWAMLRPPAGGTGLRGLSIQWEPDFVPPVWPPVPGAQQMMLHLDIAVADLQESVAWALQAGATLGRTSAAATRPGPARPGGPPVLPLHRSRGLSRPALFAPCRQIGCRMPACLSSRRQGPRMSGASLLGVQVCLAGHAHPRPAETAFPAPS